MSYSPPTWPDGRRFAFTIFDDPDGQSLEAGKAVYAFLKDRNLRTTKGVWPIRGSGPPSDSGITCEESGCLPWLQELQAAGFEIGFHNATSHTSLRADSVRALERFSSNFGSFPRAMANHFYCRDAVYWGSHRLTGTRRQMYDLLTLGRNRRISFGHIRGHPFFWGDLCREKIKYVRNFVFSDINTLKACPFMPYHDPVRPYVNYWYASSEGANAASFNECISECNQERLEAEGGACIMYTHLGHGFYNRGELNARFCSLIDRISRRNGWFVPVSTLLDYLLSQKSSTEITESERRNLEWRWLCHKLFHGTA